MQRVTPRVAAGGGIGRRRPLHWPEEVDADAVSRLACVRKEKIDN